ncbi:MAG: hypothetical protein JSC189_001326 [Candidatus Tokpelaia sp. JSC189]|nr:MAG: hypothetical protein JSC189_001326 [Candidatus Tokpelaia sp. JSC189]
MRNKSFPFYQETREICLVSKNFSARSSTPCTWAAADQQSDYHLPGTLLITLSSSSKYIEPQSSDDFVSAVCTALSINLA